MVSNENGESETGGFLRNPTVRFFSKNVSSETDLMTFDCDEEVFGGQLFRVVQQARKLLDGLNGRQVYYLLLFADWFVSDAVKHGFMVIDPQGNKHPVTEALLQCITPLDFISPLAVGVDVHGVVLGISEHGESFDIEVTVPRIYAALAVTEAFAALRHGIHQDWLAINGGYHAMLAAEAVTIARVLKDESPVTPIVRRSKLSEQARKGAKAANENKPATKAMAEIRREWERLQAPGQRYPGDADFAKTMHAKYAVSIKNEGSIKNAITRWRREGESSR